MNIFFDLDGTLIDSKKRLYRLFQHLVPLSGYSFDDYWELKRNKVSHREILKTRFNYSLAEISDFEKEWMERIELKEWLSFDQPFENVSEYLSDLSKQHLLYVVTARQFEEVALKQIYEFGWTNIFKDIFVTGQKQEKYNLISNSVSVTSEDWFIGDTGKDIQTGKLLGVRTAAVLSGFLNEESLMEYKPDLIVDNVINLRFG